MTPFLIALFIASLFCVGLHALTRPDSIFGFWSKVVRSDDGTQRFALASPLSECLVCMSSLYGTLIFGISFGFSGEFSRLFLFLLFLVFVSTIVETQSGNKETAKSSELIYLVSIGFFCAIQFQEQFVKSILFLVCLAGLNAIVSALFSAIESDKETNENQMSNSVDQASALEEIIRAIKNK